MPWSSGSFSRTNGTNSGSTTWAQDKAAGTKITASRHDTHDQDLSDGINATLNKNGENSPTANIDWGGYKITNLGAGSSATDAATIGGTETFTNKTLTSPTLTTPTLNGTPTLGDAAAWRTAIGAQASDAGLTSIAGLTTAADKMIFTTASDTYATADLSTAARALLDDTSAATMRATLGIGTATDTSAGIIEIATSAETITGTDTGRAVTPSGLHAALKGFTDTAIAATDTIIFSDASDSGNMKEDTVQGILDLVPEGGGWIPVSSATPSAASSVEFTGMTAYDQYQVVFTVTSMTSAASLYLKMSVNNGSSYTAGDGDYNYGATGVDRTNSSVDYAGNNQNQIVVANNLDTSNGDVSGEFTLINPRSATDSKNVRFSYGGGTPSGSNFYAGADGWGTQIGGTISGADVDAIQVTPSSGTITGTFYLLGRNLT